MTASYFCAGVGYLVNATFLVAVAERHPGLTGSGGVVWSAVGLGAIPGGLIADRIARRIGEGPALMHAYAVQGASILMSACSEIIAIAVLAAVLFGATFIGIVGVTLTLIGRRDPGNPARSMARLTLGNGIAQVGAPALGGGIAKVTGSYNGALYVAAFVMAAGTMLLALLQRHGRANAAVQVVDPLASNQSRSVPRYPSPR